MDIAYAGYLLFVIPGFALVWTYRHFTQAPKIGEFEYAGWSFFWGVLLFMGVGEIAILRHSQGPVIFTNDPSTTLGSLIGINLALTIVGAFPLGFIGVWLGKIGIFSWFDKKLSQILNVLTHIFQ